MTGFCTSGLVVCSPRICRRENNDGESENQLLFPLTMCWAVPGTWVLLPTVQSREDEIFTSKTLFHLFPTTKAEEDVTLTKHLGRWWNALVFSMLKSDFNSGRDAHFSSSLEERVLKSSGGRLGRFGINCLLDSSALQVTRFKVLKLP